MNSYEKILESMKSKYTELTGNAVSDLSDIDIRMKVLAGEIYKEQVNLEFVKNQMFVQTATGEYLEHHALERGLTRRQAEKSTGTVVFTLASALDTDLTIPRGTVVSTTGDYPVRFYTDNSAVIAAGKISVTVNCTAEKAGKDSNAVKGAVNVLITAVPGVNEVVNNTAFVGGTNVESDDELRQRIILSYNEISTGTNGAYYKKLALSVPGVTDVKILPKGVGTGSVGMYICSNKEPASTSMVQQVNALVTEARELNVEFRVASASKILVSFHILIKVIDGYELNDVISKVEKSFTNYVESLGIGESIDKNHLGKVVLNTEGVENYDFGAFYDNEYELKVNEFPVLDTILIEELK